MSSAPASMNHRNNFDLLRLFAACQVMFAHSSFWLHLKGPEASYAYGLLYTFPGVSIFFVISGFLVTDSYLRSTSLGSYGVKRALRIFPALFVNIAVLELALLAMGSSAITNAAKYLGYLSVYMLTGDRSWGVTASSFDPYLATGFYKAIYPSGVLWTLTVELTFYLALPLLLEVYRRNKPMGGLLVAICGVASWFMAHHYNLTDKYNEFASVTIGPYFWIFSYGVLARLCWNRLSPIFTNKALWWIVAYVGLVWTMGRIPTPYTAAAVDSLLMAVLAGVILSAAHTLPRPQLLRGQDLSYGIYLYHMLVVQTFAAMGWTGSWSLLPLAAAATVVLAAASWLLIEKPALRLRTAFVARSAGTPTSSVTSRTA